MQQVSALAARCTVSKYLVNDVYGNQHGCRFTVLYVLSLIMIPMQNLPALHISGSLLATFCAVNVALKCRSGRRSVTITKHSNFVICGLI